MEACFSGQEQGVVLAPDGAPLRDREPEAMKELLAWAGTGVAVADASPAAVADADARAPSNEEGGVLSVLEAWFPDPGA